MPLSNGCSSTGMAEAELLPTHVNLAIRPLLARKAPEPAGLESELRETVVMQHFFFVAYPCRLFKRAITPRLMPECFRISLMTPILKDGKSLTKPSSYRIAHLNDILSRFLSALSSSHPPRILRVSFLNNLAAALGSPRKDSCLTPWTGSLRSRVGDQPSFSAASPAPLIFSARSRYWRGRRQ